MYKILFIILVTLSINAHSAELSKQYSNCLNTTSTNVDWSACSNAEIDLQEKILKKVWKNVSKEMKTYSNDAFVALLDEQRAWIKYKDSACTYYTSRTDDDTPTFGREGMVLHYGACVASIIAERVEYLKNAIPR